MMRRLWATLWAVLKFAGRWLGPLLIAITAALYLFAPIPFGDPSGLPALAGGIVCAIAWAFARGPERKRWRASMAACGILALTFAGWRQWDQQRGFREETVSFENRGAHIVGTLYLPDRAGKQPGIVWIHGSGPLPRSTEAGHAAHFARLGFAVLIYDKRGVGDSTGHFEGGDRAVDPANVELLASDASTAMSLLAKRSDVRSDMIGFVGASQAGWITPRAAVLNGHAAFMLLLSGPTTSTHTQMRYERFHIGRPDPAKGPNLANIFDAFTRGRIPDGMTPDEADVEAQKRPLDLPFPDYDPVIDLRALDIPGLWLLGDADWMVPSGPTARNLDALRQLGKPYEYRHIPGAWHAMTFGPRRLVLDTIDTWLTQVAKP